MPTNWKSLAEKENAKTYVLPSGWDSRDTVAAQLDCSPEKVDDYLRPALKSGKVIKQQHRVWDNVQKRCVMVIAYHDSSKDVPSGDDLTSKMAALKKAGNTYAGIGAIVGCSGDKVRGLLRRASR